VAHRPLHVVVAGGGPAAAEFASALHEHARDRVRMTLLAPRPHDAVANPRGSGAGARGAAVPARARAAHVPEPFRAGHHDHHASTMRQTAARTGAVVRSGRIASVDPELRRVRLADGRKLAYDVLVLAVGARPRPAYTRALTFFGRAGAVAIGRLTAEVADGWTTSLAFVVPPGTTWPVPLYELAIQTAAELRHAAVPLRLVTPEPEPLAAFDAPSRAAVADLLDEARVTFTGATVVTETADGDLALPEDRVVALPTLEGPALPGIPSAGDGFVPVERDGAVLGSEDVYAIGDATATPVKQLDAALAQATAAAAAVAVRAGGYVPPIPHVPLVRAHLLAGAGRSLVLRAARPPADAVPSCTGTLPHE
jgi:sulfide:quinone oxidoreductase